MKVHNILSDKGTDVYSISPEATLQDVVTKLVEKNCGSLMVMEGDQAVGIITERDILRACAAEQRDLSRVRVAEKMSSALIVGYADQSLNDVMEIFTENRIRHLPIFEGNRLTGMVSIGDVVKVQYAQVAQENHYLKNYIQS